MTENEVAKQIVDAAFRVHTSLGPESVYEVLLAYELEQRTLRTVRQQPVPVVYHITALGSRWASGQTSSSRIR